MIRHLPLIATCLFFCHCGIVQMKGLPGMGNSSASSTQQEQTSSSSPKKASKDSTSSASDVEAQYYASTEDLQVVEILRDMYLGRLNKVSEYIETKGHAHAYAKGEFHPSWKSGNTAFKERRDQMLLASTKLTDTKALNNEIGKRVCIEKQRFHTGEVTSAERKTCEGSFGPKLNVDVVSLLREAVIFDLALSSIDTQLASKFREEFIGHFGATRRRYKYDTSDNYNRDTLYSVALGANDQREWSYRQVRYAHDYARRHKLDAALLASLATSMKGASRFRCRKMEVYFVRAYEGGGAFGPKKIGNWATAGSKIASCSDAKKVRSTGWAMKLLKKAPSRRWLSVKVSNDWSVFRERRIIKRKRAFAEVFFQEEY